MRIRAQSAAWLFLPFLSLTHLLADGDARVAEAAVTQNDKEVRALLLQGVDVNAPEPDGATALNIANTL